MTAILTFPIAARQPEQDVPAERPLRWSTP